MAGAFVWLSSAAPLRFHAVEALVPPGEPFTFGGVARYAGAKAGRLFGVALLFALLPAAVIGWLGAKSWWPVLTDAVDNLPEHCRIQDGVLQIEKQDARLLAANRFLSLDLSAAEVPSEHGPVDFAFDFSKYQLVISSLFGDLPIPYPTRWIILLDRATLVPLWGAWKVPFLLAFSALAGAGVMVTWFVLALGYAPLALMIARLGRRQASFLAAWKLSVAAQWSGALLMSFALALYSTGEIGLLFVLIMFAGHFIPTLLNVLIAPFLLPKLEPKPPARLKRNPFAPGGRRKPSGQNPFSKGG